MASHDPAGRFLSIARGPARARFLACGARLTEFHLDGFDHSLALGSADPAAYPDLLRYFGAIVGPVANRIAGGTAPLDGTPLQLDANENGNALHGGSNGVSQRTWEVETEEPHRVVFALTLADGEGGLPGPLTLTAAYEVERDGALKLEMTGRSPKRTFCNPAFHGYWSLGGDGLAGHRLTIAADHYLPTDGAMLPTGEVAPVAGTPFDLRAPTRLPGSAALDHNFCLNGHGLRAVARLETDRLAMVIETDAPGLQVYDAARLDTAPAAGHGGAPYGAHAGLALEPQMWPDAPNHPHFPSIVLDPDTPFRQTTRFKFIRKETS